MISHFFHTKKPAVAQKTCPVQRGAAPMDAGGQRRHQNLATDLWRAAQRPAYVGAMGTWGGVPGVGDLQWCYPLVICYIAIENGPNRNNS